MVQLIRHDLEFILKQIKIAEMHAEGGDLATLVGEAGAATGANGTPLQAHLLPYGLRTVDGTYNNLIAGRETWAAADQPFVELVAPSYRDENDDAIMFGTPANPVWLTNNDYATNHASPPPHPMLPAGSVVDADPRIISNLIADQTLDNPAAIAAALRYAGVPASEFAAIVQQIQNAHVVVEALDPDNPAEAPAYALAKGALDALLDQYGIEMSGPSIVLPNVAPDAGTSAPYNSIFTLFGQFFDHGLDLVAKGGNGTVYIPLQSDDPLYNPASPHTNFMAMTRVSPDAVNVTTPWIDQNQTYTSHPSHQVFLREYVMLDGKPVATGRLLDGDRGLATWADVKEQARELLGIELTDADVGNVPLVLTDPYGKFIPHPETGFAQLVVGLGPDGIPNTADDIVISGTPDAPVSTTTAVRTAHAFLDDIAHAAAPVLADGVLQPDGDDAVGYANADGSPGPVNSRGSQSAYDNELLDAHYITGDGRGNENIGLTSIHHLFHSEHNHLVDQVKEVVLATGDVAFLNEWLLQPVEAIPDAAGLADLVWNGERLFQAARFTNEMEYQHLVFEEFARKMQPDIDPFLFEPSAHINPAIFAEFAHAVYRFGHSMLNQTIDRIDAEGNDFSITLFEGFLNPLALGETDAQGNVVVDHDAAAGAVIRGMSRQTGNEIDEFVTDVLRNQLVGIPLDLAALNIARGRDTGLATLNEARAQFYAMAGNDTQLRPYTSWTDFALNIQNPESIVSFIAAYGTHASIEAATTVEGKRAAATLLVLGGTGAPADRHDFLNSTGTWASQETGLNLIDLWIGGLAEKKMQFGGMLGSTFSFVFELQMENLQIGDRFYYLSRVQGLNLLNELENNSLSEIIMRNTDLGDAGRTALPGDIFSSPDLTLEMNISKQIGADPVHGNPILQALSPKVVRLDTDNDGDTDILVFHGDEHVVIGGTDEDDIIVGGDGDDTIWGYGGDDTLEAGYGVDIVHGGAGDDIITNAGTDIGMADALHGEAGNDAINGGSGKALIFGGSGQDFIIAGPDGKSVFGGTGNDFILGGDGMDFLMGNEGDDWIEGGDHFDTLAGENSELMFNSTIIGHDVLNGQGADTDYDAESGDDIMFQGQGIQRSNGMAGFDWAIHKGDPLAANSNLGIPIFPTMEAFILRDRFDLVEGLSGWIHDDVLTGRVEPVNTRVEATGTAAIPGADSPLDSYSNALLEKNVSLIRGLDQLVAHLPGTTVTVAGKTETIVMDTADASDILLGGGGSDVITGLGGNDIIDGDRWLNVRIAIRDAEGNEIGSADGMTTKVRDAAGNELYGGRTLDALVFDRTINPGQLSIVREILDGNQEGDEDTAAYWDVMANYTITRNEDGSITVSHTGFDANANPADDNDGADGVKPVSDGTDRLFNIEYLQFADTTVSVASLFNSPATGAPVINDLSPTQGQTLTANLAGIADAEGINQASLTIRWQALIAGVWTDIAGATTASFTPSISQVNTQLRVVVRFADGEGNQEEVVSAVTQPVGIQFIGGNGADTFPGTAGADLIEGRGGNDNLSGLGGDDVINGEGGNDTLNGGDGNDALSGGAGTDTLNGDAGDDTLNGDAGNDTLNGGTGNDTLNGGAGTDTLNGGDGNDNLSGDAGNDTLNGDAGDDTLAGGAGNDTINGGAGDDTIIWNANDGRDIVNGGTENAGGDAMVINGTAGAETYHIWTRAAWIAFSQANANQAGNLNAATEIIITRNGTNNASVIAELADIEEIIINGMGGGDTFVTHGDFSPTSLFTSTITINGGSGNDTIDISSLLSAHRVVFRSNGGNDTLIGALRPQDVIELPEGTALASYVETDNGDGTKTLSNGSHSITFASSSTPVMRIADNDDDDDDDDDTGQDDDDEDDDDAGQGEDDDDDDDTTGQGDDDDDDAGVTPAPSGGALRTGTPLADVLVGTAGDDTMVAFAGEDVLVGGDGADAISAGEDGDFVNAGAGRDVVFAGAGDDQVLGGADDDMIYGDAGNDRLFGDEGNDFLNGGAGDDTVFGGAGDDLFVAEPGDGNDVYFGDDSGGGSGADTLDMSAATQDVTVNLGSGPLAKGYAVSAQTGHDVLWGIENVNTGTGDDTIIASNAVNVIDGGAGNDTFVFVTVAAADGDRILGFEPGDRLDLSGIDADAGSAGDQGFTLISEAAFSAAGQLAVSHVSRADGDFTLVQGNVSGGPDADFTIEIEGHRTLTGTNFNL